MNIARTTRKYGSVSAVLLWLGTCSGTAAAAPGDLDPTFGASGRISFDLALEAYYPPDLSATAQSDGRIVAVGTLSDADSQYSAGLFLARFEPDGSPDLTFGNGGVIGNTPLERGRAVIQQADGQLVAVGDWLGDIALLRVDGLGFADPAFGAGGIVRFDLGADDEGIAVLEQEAGRLLVAGHARRTETANRDFDIVLARFGQDGSLDSSFGSGGTATIEFSPDDAWDRVSAMTVDSAGRLLVTGYRFHEHVANFVAADLWLARLSADGVLDQTFGSNGIVQLAWGSETTSIKPYALQTLADDRIVVAGGIGGETGWGPLIPGDGFVACFLPDGALDPGFGAGGIVVENIGVHGDFDSLAILADGTVLAAGSTEAPDDDQWPTDMTLTRFLADGQVDDLFGNGGTALADFGGLGTSPRSRASTVLVQADGKAVVVGPHGLQLGLARFESGGPGFAGLIGLTVDERTIDDGDTQLEFTVHRTGGSTGAVSVEYTTIERAARSGIDFAPAEGSLIWEDSDTTDRTIVVALLADSFSEAQAQFDLELLSPTGGAVLATSRVTVDTLVTESVETVPASASASASASAAATTSTPAATSSGGGSFGPLPALLLALLCVLRSWRAATPRLERTRSL